MPVQLTAPEPVEQVRGYIVTGTDMRAAIAAERHDLAAVLRHRVRLCAHRRLIRSSDGWERAVAPEPESVAQFYAEVMAARRELDRYQRGSLGKAPPSRPGTCSSARRCRRRPTSPGGPEFGVHVHVAIRFDHQRHIEFREVGDPADHARVAVDAHPPPALELVE
jgi:hypothetical protein